MSQDVNVIPAFCSVKIRAGLAHSNPMSIAIGGKLDVSSEDTWGGSYPYLVSVDSSVDEQAGGYSCMRRPPAP